MSLLASAIRAAERAPFPDPLARLGIEYLVGRTKQRLAGASSQQEVDFARSMNDCAIAEHAAAANKQHYELSPEFFALTLGPQRKYSCCFFRPGRKVWPMRNVWRWRKPFRMPQSPTGSRSWNSAAAGVL